jgi:hypothetical protein
MNHKTVKIGINSAYDFFFEIAQPNINRFHGDPSPLTAINAAWPLWHLHEWYYWERHQSGSNDKRKKFGEELIKNECSELGLFRDIGDAAKHLRLSRKSVKVDAISIQIVGGLLGGAALGEVALGESRKELSMQVAGAAHDLRYAIGVVSRFWLGKVLPHHMTAAIAPDNLERAESMRDWCRKRLGNETCPRWKWAELQTANTPHFIQRFAFYEHSDAADFGRDFPEARPSP